MRRFLLLASLSMAMALSGCTPPSVAGRTWRPVVDAEEPGMPGRGLTLLLPGEPGVGPAGERVDPERFLVAGVHYDACNRSDPRLAGVAADRIEVRLTDLNRLCVRPMFRVAWFAIPWSELPDQLMLVDQNGSETRLQDRHRV